ncbi:sulfate ABC transporter substrate-binding protein [Limnoglobus roseus]|uniref:Sulfate ABC transporter substrate-binding protein n=1 Tax=Limnoglobus roseus TaxID=2598579 RepID=A0A5C1A7M9_9BACT|nr:sulfate ABC transporter substrate-binding protein [Limnoglobus roseus]QEL15309.1 sulfate ABC transporter substrate-binding protein [Limnoglobus roseus]
MVRKVLTAGLIVYVLGAFVWVVLAGFARNEQLLNVACDPTRELWHDINIAFAKDYEKEHGVKLGIRQSHGGSGSQARAVIDGLPGDVVTLALWTDTDAIRKAGLIEPNWEDKLPNRSLPYISTIVFVVRKGNPKNLHDWPDLGRPDVSVITPNPKTSGNGKWSFLAMWGAITTRGGTEADALEYVSQIYRRVPVLDAAARGATMTFAQKKIGDVHLTWENEAQLEVQEANGELEIVYPKVSVLAEPHVAVVDKVVDRKGTRATAEAYMKFLYTEPAQEIIAHHYYRPTNPAVKARTADRFPAIELFPASKVGPTWDAIQKRFFAEGGVFDQIYATGKK